MISPWKRVEGGSELVFIINGEDCHVEAAPEEPLCEPRDRALIQTGNIGRSFDDWCIRDDKGVTLPPNEKVGRFNFGIGGRLFLMPNVGAGGSDLDSYLKLEAAVVVLDEKDEEEAGEKLREVMDPMWYSLSEDEKRFLDGRSEPDGGES